MSIEWKPNRKIIMRITKSSRYKLTDEEWEEMLREKELRDKD